MVEGEKTLKIIEKLNGSRKAFNPNIHIASCDVLRNYTRPMVHTGLKSFLCSIIHKSVFEAMYINLYGRPESLYIPIITDVQYIKSIVKTIMNNVMRRIEYFYMPRENNMTPSNYLKKLRHFNFNSMSKIIPSLNTNSIANDSTELKYYSETDDINLGFKKTLKLGKTTVEKSQSTMTSKTHDIKLPKNHKDYWKNRKIYDSIAK